MSLSKNSFFDEISISHLQFALYLSLVVQFSMTVATAFSRQPCYYTTLLTSCQYLFKTFFKIFLGVLTGVCGAVIESLSRKRKTLVGHQGLEPRTDRL